jgi:hypothetical protein
MAYIASNFTAAWPSLDFVQIFGKKGDSVSHIDAKKLLKVVKAVLCNAFSLVIIVLNTCVQHALKIIYRELKSLHLLRKMDHMHVKRINVKSSIAVN